MNPTVNGNRPPSRTSAATAARRQRKAERLASELGPKVCLLDDRWLSALAGVIVAEVEHRGLPLPESDEATVRSDVKDDIPTSEDLVNNINEVAP